MIPRGPVCVFVNFSSCAMSRILPGHFLDLEDVVESDEDDCQIKHGQPNKGEDKQNRLLYTATTVKHQASHLGFTRFTQI